MQHFFQFFSKLFFILKNFSEPPVVIIYTFYVIFIETLTELNLYKYKVFRAIVGDSMKGALRYIDCLTC